MELVWDKGGKVYWMDIDENFIEAGIKVRTLGKGYGNGYYTGYCVSLNNESKKYARVYIECSNITWACRGHGMNDAWIEAEDNISRKRAREFIREVMKEAEQLEDETRDVKELFLKVKEFVTSNIEDYASDEDDFYI